MVISAQQDGDLAGVGRGAGAGVTPPLEGHREREAGAVVEIVFNGGEMESFPV